MLWEECGSADALWLVELVDQRLHALAGADDNFAGWRGVGHVLEFSPGLREPADGHGRFGLAVFAEEWWIADDVVDGTL